MTTDTRKEPSMADTSLNDLLHISPVIPVIAIDRLEHAVPLARALVEGGIRVLEITLRTEYGLPAIQAVAQQVDGAIVGVGTLTRPEELRLAREAGAVFGVSPGLTPSLAQAVHVSGLPLLPGVMTPSEILLAREAGFPPYLQVAWACSTQSPVRYRMCCSAPPVVSARIMPRSSSPATMWLASAALG
jgi:2-keto-3-deoxy-6-phosphogluconate aldolase